MLQHEQTDPPAVSPAIPLPVPNAADARVTPDELNAALKALEDRQADTVAIGSVVDELHLNATPEQIWEQVQKQRAQGQQTPPVETREATVTKKVVARRVLRGWREIKGWVWIVFWCTGGLGLFSGIQHLEQHGATNSSQTIAISGDSQMETVPVQGKDVVITGDGDNLTLKGQARSVTISGDGNLLQGDAPAASSVTGDGNNIQWTEGQQAKPHPAVAPRPPSP